MTTQRFPIACEFFYLIETPGQLVRCCCGADRRGHEQT